MMKNLRVEKAKIQEMMKKRDMLRQRDKELEAK